MRCSMTPIIPGLLLFLAAAGISTAHAAVVVDFEDIGASLPPNSFWNGSDESGGFTSGGLWFPNNYTATWMSWDGWAYSNTTDTTTAGYLNQYSAYTGSGYNASATYGVAFQGFPGPISIQNIPAGQLLGAYITNTTYAALSMLQGDSFAKKFGGQSGNDEDWFLLTITGKNTAGETVGTVDFYLADYRFTDNALDYVLSDWTWVDLSSLGAAGATTLEFGLTSSDVGDWGMNTPGYFALDNLTLTGAAGVPEPATLWLAGLAVGLFTIRRRRG